MFFPRVITVLSASHFLSFLRFRDTLQMVMFMTVAPAHHSKFPWSRLGGWEVCEYTSVLPLVRLGGREVCEYTSVLPLVR